jgi:hypothetical protein
MEVNIMKKESYCVHGLTSWQLTNMARDAFREPDNYKDVRFIFDSFGNISHLEADLTIFRAIIVKIRMAIDNLMERDSKYVLIKK